MEFGIGNTGNIVEDLCERGWGRVKKWFGASLLGRAERMKKQWKHYTPEEKVAILRRHLLDKELIS